MNNIAAPWDRNERKSIWGEVSMSAPVAPKYAMINRWAGVPVPDQGREYVGMSTRVTKTASGVSPFREGRETKANMEENTEKHQYLWTDDILLT